MKQLKTFSIALLALAVTVIAAGAGTAAASTFTSPEGTTYTGEIVATSTGIKMQGVQAFLIVNECGHAEVRGKVEQHGYGESATNVGGQLSTLAFSNCSYYTYVKKKGMLEITSSGAVISKNVEIEIQTPSGICVLTTDVTVGTAVGSFSGGTSPTWSLESAKIPRTGGNFACGSTFTWTGSFEFTTPSSLWVD